MTLSQAYTVKIINIITLLHVTKQNITFANDVTNIDINKMNK